MKRARKEFGRRVVSTISRGEFVQFLRGLAATSVRNANKTQSPLCKMYNWINLEDKMIVGQIGRYPPTGTASTMALG